MSEKRIPSRFAVYRQTETGTVFMSNHHTEGGAKHTAACFQVCAPVHVSFVVDPPHGTLAARDGGRGLRAIFGWLFART
jgi:hypothetical protein